MQATFPKTLCTSEDEILTIQNKSNKTPFQIAIEKGNIE